MAEVVVAAGEVDLSNSRDIRNNSSLSGNSNRKRSRSRCSAALQRHQLRVALVMVRNSSGRNTVAAAAAAVGLRAVVAGSNNHRGNNTNSKAVTVVGNAARSAALEASPAAAAVVGLAREAGDLEAVAWWIHQCRLTPRVCLEARLQVPAACPWAERRSVSRLALAQDGLEYLARQAEAVAAVPLLVSEERARSDVRLNQPSVDRRVQVQRRRLVLAHPLARLRQ